MSSFFLKNSFNRHRLNIIERGCRSPPQPNDRYVRPPTYAMCINTWFVIIVLTHPAGTNNTPGCSIQNNAMEACQKVTGEGAKGMFGFELQ